MKKNKVIFAGMAGLALVAAIAPAALAADASVTTPQEKESHVTYEVTAGYEWSVPRMIDFGKDKGVNATSEVEMKGEDTVKVTKNVIPDGQKLHITIAGKDGAFQIKNGNTTLSYTVSKVGTDGTSSTPVNSGSFDSSCGNQRGKSESRLRAFNKHGYGRSCRLLHWYCCFHGSGQVASSYKHF